MWNILSSVIERFVPATPSLSKDVDQLQRDAESHQAALAEYDNAANVDILEEPKQDIKEDECFTNTGTFFFISINNCLNYKYIFFRRCHSTKHRPWFHQRNSLFPNQFGFQIRFQPQRWFVGKLFGSACLRRSSVSYCTR